MRRSSQALAQNGNALAASGKLAEAISSLRKAVAAGPDKPLIKVRLVELLLDHGDSTEALTLAEETTKGHPGQVEAWTVLARAVAEGPKDGDRAEALYRKAIAMDPGSPRARGGLAWLLVERGRFEEALVEFRAVKAARPTDPRGWAGEAWALVGLGRAAEARAVVDQAERFAPNDDETAHAVARFLAMCPKDSGGDPARALAIMDRLVAKGPGIERAETHAIALAAAGQTTEAATAQRNLLGRIGGAGPLLFRARLAENLARYEKGQTATDPLMAKLFPRPPAEGPPKNGP